MPPSQRKAEGDAYSFTKSLLPYDSSEIRENIRSGFVTYYTFFFYIFQTLLLPMWMDIVPGFKPKMSTVIALYLLIILLK